MFGGQGCASWRSGANHSPAWRSLSSFLDPPSRPVPSGALNLGLFDSLPTSKPIREGCVLQRSPVADLHSCASLSWGMPLGSVCTLYMLPTLDRFNSHNGSSHPVSLRSS